jgi:hypothetical protein
MLNTLLSIRAKQRAEYLIIMITVIIDMNANWANAVYFFLTSCHAADEDETEQNSPSDAEVDSSPNNLQQQLHVNTTFSNTSAASRRRSSGADSDSKRVSSKPPSPIDGRFPGPFSPSRARSSNRSSSPAILSPSTAMSTRSPSPQHFVRQRPSSYRKSLEGR